MFGRAGVSPVHEPTVAGTAPSAVAATATRSTAVVGIPPKSSWSVTTSKSCKGLSKQMPNGGAFVIKCSEDRGSPLVLFLGGEEKECRLVMKRSSGGSEEKPKPSEGLPVTSTTTPTIKEENEQDESISVPFETLVDKLPPHLDKSVVEDCIGVAADLHKNGLPESKSIDGVYAGNHHGFSIAVGKREELLRDDEDGEPKYFTPWEANQIYAKPEPHVTSEFARRNAFNGDGMAVVDGKTGDLIAFGMIGLSLKHGGAKGGGRHKSCKGLSKQMPNGGAFVIKCSEDRGKPLLMFLDGEQGVKPSEDKSEGAGDSARVAQLEAALKEKEAEMAAALTEKEKEMAAALAEKEAELIELREMIAERQRWRAQSPAVAAVRDP